MNHRDTLISSLLDLAKKDDKIMLVTADMGAPALDEFRDTLPKRYLNVGIAEQNAISVSTGLMLGGMKVVFYSIGPFGVTRCFDQIRMCCGILEVPLTIAIVSAGVGYANAGPTHYSTEDVALMRTVPGMRIVTPSHSSVLHKYVQEVGNTPTYIRLDRENFDDPRVESAKNFMGFSVVFEGDSYIIACGYSIKVALEVHESAKLIGKSVGVIDAREMPMDTQSLFGILDGKKAIVLEEQLYPGGLFQYLSCENLTGSKLIPANMECKHRHIYGGRSEIYRVNKMSATQLLEQI